MTGWQDTGIWAERKLTGVTADRAHLYLDVEDGRSGMYQPEVDPPGTRGFSVTQPPLPLPSGTGLGMPAHFDRDLHEDPMFHLLYAAGDGAVVTCAA